MRDTAKICGQLECICRSLLESLPCNIKEAIDSRLIQTKLLLCFNVFGVTPDLDSIGSLVS